MVELARPVPLDRLYLRVRVSLWGRRQGWSLRHLPYRGSRSLDRNRIASCHQRDFWNQMRHAVVSWSLERVFFSLFSPQLFWKGKIAVAIMQLNTYYVNTKARKRSFWAFVFVWMFKRDFPPPPLRRHHLLGLEVSSSRLQRVVRALICLQLPSRLWLVQQLDESDLGSWE